ncbi:MAG: NAD(+) synthase, partial [Acetivibrio sp.]
YEPWKIYRIARYVFQDEYRENVISKWLKLFYRRFFSQQYKRSCLPDGPKVGSVALSPRGDWRMPSDACVDAWIRQLEEI